MSPRLRPCGLAVVVFAVGCDAVSPPTTLAPPIDTELRDSLQRWSVVPIAALPAQDSALVALGQALFFDPIL
ncbi:MAG TPA: hypothetical protein VM736_12515, partial [Gemmatimonadales bacterium]|nr:hypothetical protein [Gemmatimonadales bacterium]